jgi:hypothetical protein
MNSDERIANVFRSYREPLSNLWSIFVYFGVFLNYYSIHPKPPTSEISGFFEAMTKKPYNYSWWTVTKVLQMSFAPIVSLLVFSSSSGAVEWWDFVINVLPALLPGFKVPGGTNDLGFILEP